MGQKMAQLNWIAGAITQPTGGAPPRNDAPAGLKTSASLQLEQSPNQAGGHRLAMTHQLD